MSDLTPEQQVLKDAYVKARGYWRPWTEGLLRLDPAFLRAYGRYAGYAAEKGPLSPKMCELIYVALDGSATHLFRSGLALHLRLALKAGATAREIIDVFRLATAQGLDGCNLGIGILAEELANAGVEVDRSELTREQRALRDAYVAQFGDWPDFCEQWLRSDPGYFAVLLDLLADRHAGGGLDQRSQCLISIALNACFTALDPHGLRVQIKRALRLGVDQREIRQVLQMTAHLGVHACAVGVPVLMEALEERSSKAASDENGAGQ
ncbi:carboxymuconolactone decarboxylase family protein [Bradyrhizobium sp. GCM10027634]|uniref:carboxymuconolactone decarboxylase family protein n=1 Tax=unclassified Bradyrhizobium TaxID=2631580 RepID=UPI00263BDCDE|nr:carboxymuconolactone decarboxylase family protein [Bradyrhizobium sp. WYCCWR 12677]MDN5004308.1 carboxymuconolactone decarboxylase family protein [Bradyrhizobium sp. WYCCWR 12677]